METAKEFLLREEAAFVNAIDEKTFMEEKVYFPDEVIKFMTDYASYVITETKNKEENSKMN